MSLGQRPSASLRAGALGGMPLPAVGPRRTVVAREMIFSVSIIDAYDPSSRHNHLVSFQAVFCAKEFLTGFLEYYSYPIRFVSIQFHFELYNSLAFSIWRVVWLSPRSALEHFHHFPKESHVLRQTPSVPLCPPVLGSHSSTFPLYRFTCSGHFYERESCN